MFVKLSFSADKSWNSVRQIINAIINDTGINSVSALSSTAASWNAGITAGLDYTNSEIIRTVEPTTVKSHFADNSTTYAHVAWTLEFQVHDTPSRKYYISFTNGTTASATNNTASTIEVGDTIASGTMDGPQASMAVDLDVPSNGPSGTPVRLASAAPAQYLSSGANHYDVVSPINFTNFRTFWMYLTNDCLIIASTHGTSSNLGFNATYNSQSAYTGPYIFSQYTRYDYHNTNANGVIPLMFSNITRTPKGTQGFGGGFALFSANDWDRIENVNYNSTGGFRDTAFRVFNFIDAHPQVGTSWPLTSFPQVNWGSGSRVNEIAALTTKSALENTATTTAQHPRLIHTTSQIRHPSSDLRTLGYAMLPLQWANSYRFNRGGNATNRGGFYIFNGEYFPGDQFVHNNKTYMIWPTYNGYVARVGLAVPKE